MKVKHQMLIAVLLAMTVFGWAFFQLILPWLQRTFSDPELESSGAQQSPVVNQLVLEVVQPRPVACPTSVRCDAAGSPGIEEHRRAG